MKLKRGLTLSFITFLLVALQGWMSKSKALIAGLATVMVSLMPTAILAQVPPCAVIGTAYLDDNPVSQGTVSILIDEEEVASATTEADGSFYVLVTDNYAGEEMSFKVEDVLAQETATWESGLTVELDLHAITLPELKRITFDPSKIKIYLDTAKATNITLDRAPNGISGYNITISLSNESVAEITSVNSPSWGSLNSNSHLPADSIWIKAADPNREIESGAMNVTLATLAIRGDELGSSNIFITVTKMDDDSGNPIEMTTIPGQVEVGVVVIPFLGWDNPPTDPDNDGLCEDINGNERKDFDGVVCFFKNLEWADENQPCECFNFNENGRIDFDDVVKLFEKI